jgi:ribosomal protein L24E
LFAVPSPFSKLVFVPARAFALIVLVSTALVGIVGVARAEASTAPTVGAAATATGHGYWSVQSDGTVSSFGDAKAAGSAIARNIVGIAPTKSGNGYWLATSDGNVLTFGDAVAHGSLAFRALSQPILGITATPSGKGYRMVASDGGIFSFGDARFYGSTGNIHLNKPVVAVAPTPTGRGYWLVASDGGIFSFGDARFYGSTGNIRLNEPVVGVAPTPTGHGYWLVASDGGIFSFGDARFFGSIGGRSHDAPIAQFVKTPTGNGYWEFAFDGGVFTFGAAHFYGSSPHPFVPPERDFVFPFQDHAAPAPASTWTQDQGVDVFLKHRGADACGSIGQPARRDGPVLVAVAAGTIVGEGIGGFGPSAPVLRVEHGPLTGMYVYYGHTSGDLVGVGAHVAQGQPITHVGCGIVGQSNEPHVEIGMGPSYPGLTPCGSGCHGSSTSAAMLHWLLTTQ